ncbi:S-methyl-5-thioribose kinase [Bacillus sp. FJAT-45037]|uniref:S-methyl-5-thioribose kinase n=1 Tax=Bacillus sp. FJAT-45037 TaxID=2011007 RepID=UPI000C2401E0|nr:S-methyl-5-thioribose kinase [Bacillus sp. FJAT-45037]
MTNFTVGYFTMTETEAIEYAKSTLHFFTRDADLSCKEIGDGNLNYVFRIVDSKTGQSLIIKQAGPCARISDEFKLSPDRNRIESEILRFQGELAPGFVPDVYHYDPVMNCCAMEDLSSFEILRTALLKHQMFPHLADHLSTFLVKTLLSTSDLVLGHKEKKELVKKFTNPELCEITEDLVYTEPFYNCPRNDVFEGTLPFVEAEIWNDSELALETAKLKFDFLTNTQSLLHGDFHTGSIFVTEFETKIIDPEFAFYGPAGYDLGNIVANLIFAYVNAAKCIGDKDKRDSHLTYLQTTIEKTIDLFKSKFIHDAKHKVTEQVAGYDGFIDHYLDRIIRDAAAVTGLELCRRVIGIAHVKDLTEISDQSKRVEAEVFCLKLGKSFILNSEHFRSGTDFKKALIEN